MEAEGIENFGGRNRFGESQDRDRKEERMKILECTGLPSKGRVFLVLLLILGLSGSIVSLQGCAHTVKNTYTPTEWQEVLKQAGGWVPLPYPESAFRPGSIILVTDKTIRWIDHLETCRYPSAILEPEKSRIPNISFEKAVDFGVNAVIGYKGIRAGPKFSNVSKVSLEVQDHDVEYLRLIRFKEWVNDPANKSKISPGCMDELGKPDRYLVTDAFRVSKGTFTLLDQTGAALDLSTPVLKEVLQISGDVKYEITSNGKLVIDTPVYFAVRRAVRMQGEFEPRDPAQIETADAKIERLYLKAVGER